MTAHLRFTNTPTARRGSGRDTRGPDSWRLTAVRTRSAGPAQPRWERRYRRAIVASDLSALLAVVAVGHLLGLGANVPSWGGEISPGLGLLVAVLAGACLSLGGAWDPAALGQASEELARLVRAFVAAAVILAIMGVALRLPAVRPWVFGLLPLAGLLSLIGRCALRAILRRHRAAGRCVHELLAVGTSESVADLIRRARRDPENGWVVTGACTPTGRGPDGGDHVSDVPVLGDLDGVVDVARRGRHRIVTVGTTPGWTNHRLQQLAWDLEPIGTDLVVDPGLMEVTGARLQLALLDGLPLLRLTRATFAGVPRAAKSVIDRVGAAALLLVSMPLLGILAVAVRLDGGPVLFRQVRIGQHGRPFTMFKIRSMVVDAEGRKGELLKVDEGAGPLFKLRTDPRVTRVGTWMRRYSLDEVPQLLNVLAGDMSLVGPRPPLPDEVTTYRRDAERKLLVKPGLTGLWQVSGRSDLSWEESVRLDLRYVENWTLALDAVILWRTIGTIVRGHGAY